MTDDRAFTSSAPSAPTEPDHAHDAGSAAPHAHQPRLIPLWVVGVVAGVLVLVLLVVVVALKGSSTPDANATKKVEQQVVDETGINSATVDADHPAQRDIRIGTCESDGESGVRAAGTITNWTSVSSDYRVTVSFRDDENGTEFGSTVLTLAEVEPHRTQNWSASVPSRPDLVFTCRVVTIDRWQHGTTPPG